MSRSTNWESAYQGKMIQVAASKRPARRRHNVHNDFSQGMLILFYAAVALGVLSYFVYLNQDRIRELYAEKAPKAQQVSKMVLKK